MRFGTNTNSTNTKSVEISGQLLTKDGTQPISNAKMEVWHLTPGT